MPFLNFQVPTKAYFGGATTPTDTKDPWTVDIEAQPETSEKSNIEKEVTPKKPGLTRKAKVVRAFGLLFALALVSFAMLIATGVIPTGPRIFAPANVTCTDPPGDEGHCAYWFRMHEDAFEGENENWTWKLDGVTVKS